MIQDNIIIIPDVHGRSFWKEAVEKYPLEQFIFLGDYLDPYPDEGFSEGEAFQGLQEIVRFKEEHPGKVTLLWGNHDLHYLYPEMMGSRYDIRHAERNARFFSDHQTLFNMAYETQVAGKRFLFSHAGVGRGWIRSNWPSFLMDELSAELFNGLTGYPGFMSALGDVSAYRWGDQPYGSMVWADCHEQMEGQNRLPGIIQIFGHTLTDKPSNFDDAAYCLDCCTCFYLDGADGTVRYLNDGRPV